MTTATLRKQTGFLAALLIALLLAAGCSSRQERAPVTTKPVQQERSIRATTDVPPPVPPAVTDSAPVDRQDTVQAGAEPAQQARGPESTQAPAAGKVTQPAAKTADGKGAPVAQLLRSAGRDTDPASQPETGFMLAVPGSVGDGEAFPVQFGASGAQKVDFLWRGKTVSISSPNPGAGTFQAMLAVALDEKSKSLPLGMTVHWADGKTETFKADLPVKKRKYPVQRLKVNPKYVSPPPEMAEKIKRDRAEMRAAVGKVSPRQYWTLPMLRPVPGEVTSLYGLRREFNGVPKAPHKGVDFDAKEGDPILSAEDGVVVLVSEHYYGGNTVVVDHGLGVLTAYLHMSAFNVSVGQQVKRGDTLGLIGSTGRVTGPHLHLSLYVLGESVNAATCLDM